MLGAWPGNVPIGRLRLRKLSTPAVIIKVLKRLLHVMMQPQFAGRIQRSLRRIAAGRPIGMETASQGVVTCTAQSTVEPGDVETVLSSRVADDAGFVSFLSPDDELHRDAAAIIQREFSSNPNLKAIVSDVRTPGGIWHVAPPNRQLLRHYRYAGVPAFLRNGRASPMDWSIGLEPEEVKHIALPLVERSQIPAGSAFHELPLPILTVTPTVSIIIPTARRTDLLRKSLKGLCITDYPALQVIIVDNGADPTELRRAIQEEAPGLDLTVIRDHSGFNFSRLCNVGVKASSGSVILLLNDDVEAINADWLTRMVDSVLEDGVGAVGARLLYPDHSLQHAGLMIGLGGIAGHFWKGFSTLMTSFNPHITYPGDRLAVTGACLAVKREVYESVAGLDEVEFPIGFSDVDFCLRLVETGRRNVYRGDAVLIHHESQSRGLDDVSVKKSRSRVAENQRFLARWKYMCGQDPVLTSGYDLRSETAKTHRAVA
jgi:GT2 family glycosyltransferase